jgi:stress response protein YsnF
MSYSRSAITKNAFSMFDMMLEMQRIGMRAATAYQPFAAALGNGAKATAAVTRDFPQAPRASYEENAEKVIGLGEEVLNVGTRMVPGKTTRLRRVTVETPVQQDVTLHTETVVVERRQPVAGSDNEVLTEVTIEMSDFNEVPVVSKSVHLVEEVLLRKEVTARIETIRETVKRDKLEVDQPSNLPVVFKAEVKEADDEHDTDAHANESQHGKRSMSAAPASNRPRQKRG